MTELEKLIFEKHTHADGMDESTIVYTHSDLLEIIEKAKEPILKALKEITEKYADNSSYFEDHLLNTDEVYKQAVEALK